MPQINAEFVLM